LLSLHQAFGHDWKHKTQPVKFFLEMRERNFLSSGQNKNTGTNFYHEQRNTFTTKHSADPFTVVINTSKVIHQQHSYFQSA